MSDRRAELEKKRQRLAQLQAEKERRQREKEAALAEQASANVASSGKKTGDLRREEANVIFAELGIDPVGDITQLVTSQPAIEVTNEVITLEHPVEEPKKKTINLTLVNINEINIPPKESVTYNKQTQTADSGRDGFPYRSPGDGPSKKKAHPVDYYETDSVDFLEWEDEFQVLTYDDKYAHDEEDAEGSSLQYGNSTIFPKVSRQVSTGGSGLPNVGMVEPAKTPLERETREEIKEPVKEKKELTEERKLQIMNSPEFLKFFDRATRIVEKALFWNESPDIFIDYTGAKEDMESEDQSGASLTFNKCFYDERWSKNRTVTCFDWSAQFPELLAVSYNNNEDSPTEPDGVCLIWNMKFRKTTPEYVLHCQSPLMSVCFAKFHPNLIVGGTYSGQIVLWDNRVNKRTPIQRSPLSASAHTHPIYCIQVVGTQNAHNLITVSTDGKLCSWSLDMLSSPQDTMELSQQKQAKPVAVTSISFPYGDYNNFILGSEEGAVYTACRHGSKAGILDIYEGHQGPVTNVDCHSVNTQIDFSHLYLTSSIDWTVKLWSMKDKTGKPLYSFEDNCDYVYDVRWSPVHPALFATVDGMGRIDVWNLNNDTELPTATVALDGSPALNRVMWTPSGNQLAIGDDNGKVYIYDVGEQLAYPKGDESTKLMLTLQELKMNKVEPDVTEISSDAAYSSMSSTLSPFSSQSLR
ncbi:cytoplasmic dynein 1 intermediate chain 1-like isoform X2 [Panonychus citri]|uniref:cytoplasmic dynein 1 intermediate chain 1-like isoform X2 n=1 Tax=Panonychus citri TaxID=50023 RepID=UPI002306EBC8|nr:cytoplasmic dynein 1 intermediate chain 1-like isoform X2 [Panonychus citri]